MLPPVVAITLLQAVETDVQIGGSKPVVNSQAMLTCLYLNVQLPAEVGNVSTTFVPVMLAHLATHVIAVASGVVAVFNPVGFPVVR